MSRFMRKSYYEELVIDILDNIEEIKENIEIYKYYFLNDLKYTDSNWVVVPLKLNTWIKDTINELVIITPKNKDYKKIQKMYNLDDTFLYNNITYMCTLKYKDMYLIIPY
jgi:hypothetical protein